MDLRRFAGYLRRRVPAPIFARFIDPAIVRAFHMRYYHSSDTWPKNRWQGVPIQQLPSDLLLYQELIHSIRPQAIVQTGVLSGGSLLFFAHMLDLSGVPDAPVIGVDIKLTDQARSLVHPRVRLIEGSSIADEMVEAVARHLDGRKALVVLDSDHTRDHVLEELRKYSRFVPPGGYLVVEDSNLNGRPVHPTYGPGPGEATDEFLKQTTDFVRDDGLWQRQLFSFHQYGWLRRRSA